MIPQIKIFMGNVKNGKTTALFHSVFSNADEAFHLILGCITVSMTHL